MTSSSVMVHGKWSSIRPRDRLKECVRQPTESTEHNNKLLKLLPDQLLPVHRHLQRQLLEKEREQESHGEEQAEEHCLQSERNFQKTVPVSVDDAENSEGRMATFCRYSAIC